MQKSRNQNAAKAHSFFPIYPLLLFRRSVPGAPWRATLDLRIHLKRKRKQRDFQLKHAEYAMVEEDQQHALISTCPPGLKQEVLREYTKEMSDGRPQFPTYLALKQLITNLISRDHDISSASKGVNTLGGRAGGKKDEDLQDQPAAAPAATAQATATEENTQWYPQRTPDIQNLDEVYYYMSELNALKGAGQKGQVIFPPGSGIKKLSKRGFWTVVSSLSSTVSESEFSGSASSYNSSLIEISSGKSTST